MLPDPHDPYFYLESAAIAALTLALYWFIWKKNSLLANVLVFCAVIALLVYLVDWNYFLNHYFRISGWHVPGS